MQATYNLNHGDLLSAFTTIRRVSGSDLVAWPEQLGATYGVTQAAFDVLVNTMRSEGEAYFADVEGTNFDDYVGLRRLQRTDDKVDWSETSYGSHVDALRKKKLLELRLI